MIKVRCPSCNSSLNAKDKLAGQTRKCPKCGTPVLIVRQESEISAPEESASSDQPVTTILTKPPGESSMLALDTSEKLARSSYYLICNNKEMVACWENDGRGWKLKTRGGLVSALRNPENIPNEGNFQLVEFRMESTDEGLRLNDILCCQLAQRWALTALTDGENAILSKITGPGSLDRNQKAVVRQAMKDRFMRPIWAEAVAVLEYLANTDYHSPGTLKAPPS